jgi:CP family cyanate transporter-like MFS transporter
VTSSRAGALVALFLVALTLRPQIVGAGPLFPAIEDDLEATHAVVGLLGTIPVLCMGLFAPPAAWLTARVGTRSAMAAAVALVGIFGLARAMVPGVWLVVALTWPIGIGMGLAGALAPVAIKERFADRPATATGIYTTGIQLGSATTSAIAVPVAHSLGGWRVSLALFSAATCALVGSWLALTRREPEHVRVAERPPKLPWRNRTAWLLVLVFALMASTYYGINSWLADSFVERGWGEGEAGALLAVLNACAIPGSFLVPALSDRHGGRRPWLLAMGAVFLAGVAGYVLLPEAGYLWSACAGLASGAMFTLVLTLPLDYEHRPAGVGALVGMMLGLGYTIGAASPVVLGVVRDVTGSFTGALWLDVAFCAGLLAAVAALPRARASRDLAAQAAAGR